MRSTYTYVTLDVSQSAFEEISRKLEEAGYYHLFHRDHKNGPLVIDMHGLALQQEPNVVKEVREHIIQQ